MRTVTDHETVRGTGSGALATPDAAPAGASPVHGDCSVPSRCGAVGWLSDGGVVMGVRHRAAGVRLHPERVPTAAGERPTRCDPCTT